VKRFQIYIIAFFVFFAQTVIAQDYSKAELSIKFYDKTMYYAGDAVENPVLVHITIANRGNDTLRFKLADDRAFSIDFNAFTVKNTKLATTPKLIQKRTTNQTVFFREISLESGEEYSFVENLKDYLVIDTPSVYYFEVSFYPELYRSKINKITSNRLSLEIRPSPSITASTFIPVNATDTAILQPEAISPDKVVEQTIIARQKTLWDQYFLYMDIEEMLLRDPVRSRKYRVLSDKERNQMIVSYKADLMQDKIDTDITSIPERFEIEKTTYTKTDGYVSVIEWFKYNNYYEKKRFTYYVRQRNGIWQIYNYTVDNLGTE
jgi:hypothetical protein